MISVIGIPTDKNSSYLRGSSLAPEIILKEFQSDARNTFAENGVKLSLGENWENMGSLNLKELTPEQEFDHIRSSIEDQLKNKNYCIALGGDHSITYPITNKFFSPLLKTKSYRIKSLSL